MAGDSVERRDHDPAGTERRTARDATPVPMRTLLACGRAAAALSEAPHSTAAADQPEQPAEAPRDADEGDDTAHQHGSGCPAAA
ncbi:hypothetical protein [Allostreptomyces psammosilenae]|uniref:Uncharacterized protein n=1 Tax=Allostreptomyces psammosilenae TaxID=1892865 RepID=A0A852ZXH9_9ACTN|nr:hypothetical protein [Allostreptomyces psammosilenae]NYI05950.1 hypothetical protein [Allostreptomyces psammosilenae]